MNGWLKRLTMQEDQVVPALVYRESEDGEQWSVCREGEAHPVPQLRSDWSRLGGHPVQPVWQSHPGGGGGERLEKLLRLPGPAGMVAVEGGLLRRWARGHPCRLRASHGPQNRLLLEELPLDPTTPSPTAAVFPQETAYDLGAVLSLSNRPYNPKLPHEPRRFFLIRSLPLEHHLLLVRSTVPMFDGSVGQPLVVFSNRSSEFSRWLDLALEMWCTGASRALIAYRQKKSFVRVESYDASVIESMCEEELVQAKATIVRILDQLIQLGQDTVSVTVNEMGEVGIAE